MAFSSSFPPSPALLTDLYQLTMAYGYWKAGIGTLDAVFHLMFRTNPFGGGYSVACGLDYAAGYVERFRFEQEDIDFLSTLTGNDGCPLFEPEFFDYLVSLRMTCDIDAVPEGTVVFPHEPLIRVKGPIIHCQLLETPLLNMINFQTLIATKATRVCLAANRQPVLEFGLRRAQGFDGALAASRAAYIGGCAGTSNVLAGKLFGIPVKGTHAHSWVMAFESEREAFLAWARSMPNNCIFLVDTYDSLEGVRHAVEAGKLLRKQGHELIGIRLDSGDLAWLSTEARKILDEAGFEKAVIVASSELDEHIIESLRLQGAAISVWGVGTKLVTAHGDPALGGVYKLSAVREHGGKWEYRIKVSEQTSKSTTPGILQIRRFRSNRGVLLGDMIFDTIHGPGSGNKLIDPLDITRRKRIPPQTPFTDLLIPVFRKGRRVYSSPSIHEIRQQAIDRIDEFHGAIKRLVNPHRYPVGLEESLYERKTRMVLKMREKGVK
jgi:nicotinate phosphoribosyltransferase